MSKKKRRQNRDYPRLIHQSLRVNFFCTDEEIELIDSALEQKVPPEIADHMHLIHEGKVPLPPKRTFILDMGDGTNQTFSLTNHPAILLCDYLIEKYDRVFGLLYWNALSLSSSSQDFYEALGFFKRLFQGEDKDLLEARKTALHKMGGGEVIP